MRIFGWICGGLLAATTAIALATIGSEWHAGRPLPGAAAPVTPEEAAMRAVRARLRNRDAVEFPDLRVFRFGPEDERAVCGRIQPAPDAPDAPADFVVRILLPRPAGNGARVMTILEEGPGIPRFSEEAWRRYCRDAADPVAPWPAPPGGAHVAGPAGPDEAATGSGAPATAVAGGRPAPPMVVVRSPANLRAGPGGWAAILRTAPRGEAFRVHGHAPGGWVQVGDMERPRGWVHSSLLDEVRP